MHRTGIFIVVFFLSLFFGASPGYATAQEKIALVSFQKALNDVNEGKQVKASLKADFDAKQKQLESMKTELKKMRDDLDKQKMVLSEDALKAKAGELQTKFMDLQNRAAQYENELKTKEAQNADRIISHLRTLAVALAKEKQYDLVVENSADIVVYSAKAEDITGELIRRYNSNPAPKK
ncbi:MAG: OmpH family outer membrane protein [Deltaproteobacteria bacterium]|nr:OmpH family outer membrane protein [Deltaproteobacteria bacterium]